MDRNLIGYNVGPFGLGILVSAIIYPIGYLESEILYHSMTSIGTAFIVLGIFIRPSFKKQS